MVNVKVNTFFKFVFLFKKNSKKSNVCFLSNKANGLNGVCLTLTDCSSKNCLNGKCQGKKEVDFCFKTRS